MGAGNSAPADDGRDLFQDALGEVVVPGANKVSVRTQSLGGSFPWSWGHTAGKPVFVAGLGDGTIVTGSSTVVILWDATGNVTKTLDLKSDVSALAVLGDGTTLAVAIKCGHPVHCESGAIAIVDTDTSTVARVLNDEAAGEITSMNVLGDGTTLQIMQRVGARKVAMKLWDTLEGHLVVPDDPPAPLKEGDLVEVNYQASGDLGQSWLSAQIEAVNSNAHELTYRLRYNDAHRRTRHENGVEDNVPGERCVIL
jgi:hypothetical protein